VDLLSLIRTFWRFKFASLSVIGATIGLAVGFVLISPSDYEATASYLLVEPPDPPSEAEIKADPRLARIQADNPFMRYSDSSVIVNVVAQQVSRGSVREWAQAAGGNPEYEVWPSKKFGGPSPIVDITATGSSQAEVLRTLDFVGKELSRQLRAVQEAENVNRSYMFTARRVEYPDSAKRVVTGTLRAVIGIGFMGALALVVLLALLQARSSSLPATKPDARPRRRPAPANAIKASTSTRPPPSTRPPSTRPPSTRPPSTRPPSTKPPSTRTPSTRPPSS